MVGVISVVFALAFQSGQPDSASRGFLGLALEDTPQSQGAKIAQVAPGGPAARAGLEAGDILVAVNGTPTNGAAATSRLIRSLQSGRPARLTVVRARSGQRQEITVAVGVAKAPVQNSAPAPSSTPANVRFERLTDPVERAFTIEAPAGWRSVLGLARTGLVQVNPYLRSVSPDKMTYLLFGDPTFPTFLVPNQMRTAIGMREGSVSSEGVGGRSEIRRYQAGVEFARSYGQVAFGGLCAGLKLVSSRDRPDNARKIEQMDHNVVPTRYDAGEAEFTCVHNKQEMSAFDYAVTWITRDQLGMWVVRGFAGFITPKDNAGQAHGILDHMIESLRWEDAWNQRQTELSRQAGEIIKGRIAESERQQAAFNAKLNAVDQSFQDMDDIITGRSEYYDARTGTRYDLSNSAPFKWINDGGRIVGTTDNQKPPGYSWRPLQTGKGR